MENKLHVAVTGGADAPREALNLAFAVGYEVVRRGHVLLNGGAKGVDYYAVHGGDKYGEEIGVDFDGEMIAFRPQNAQQPASSRYTEVRVVGNTHAERRDAVVRNCDILIVLSGGSGTMDIAKRARNYGKPVIPIGCSKGAALELWHKLIEDDGKFFRTCIASYPLGQAAGVRELVKEGGDSPNFWSLIKYSKIGTAC